MGESCVRASETERKYTRERVDVCEREVEREGEREKREREKEVEREGGNRDDSW